MTKGKPRPPPGVRGGEDSLDRGEENSNEEFGMLVLTTLFLVIVQKTGRTALSRPTTP